jgi:hypothetical protein
MFTFQWTSQKSYDRFPDLVEWVQSQRRFGFKVDAAAAGAKWFTVCAENDFDIFIRVVEVNDLPPLPDYIPGEGNET